MAMDISVEENIIKVWPDGASDDTGAEAELFVYLPHESENTGAAIVICPGGGYEGLAIDHEGIELAEFLQEKGVAGIVLKYRLPYGHHEVPSSDARRAVRMVRAHAVSWGIDPNKIGIAGSSAGGHLASTVGTVFDSGDPESDEVLEQQSCRPDFMLLLYPVITMNEEFTHLGSRKSLIGNGHDAQLVRKYSNELNVSAETPPTFLVLADDDAGVPPRNSIEFYAALKRFNIPAEMHIFQQGGHGFGMHQDGLPANNWPDLFMDWLKARNIIE